MTNSAPAGMEQRIETLDIVRGVAVMGILTMNIVGFALPSPDYFNPVAYGAPTTANIASWAVDFILFDGKMRFLFALLFGASTLLVIDRATRSGMGGAKVHYARMAVLLAIGLLHYYFIWFGDILVPFALAGMILYPLCKLAVKWLVTIGLTLIILQNLVYGVFAGSALMASSPDLPPQVAAELAPLRQAIEDIAGPASAQIATELAVYRGSYGEIVAYRLLDNSFEPFIFAGIFGAEMLGVMLLGMALFRTGFLTGEWPAARYRRWALVCGAIALPTLILLARWQAGSGFDAAVVFLAGMPLSQPFDMLLGLAWAALIVSWAKTGGWPMLRARVAAAGRMAFTNYLATSIVMTTIFYGYGLGLFGEVGRAALWPFVLGMWALMLAWSKPWLDRSHYGPFEWMWRSLARGQLQPMRR